MKNSIKYYLATYNLLAFLFWLAYLIAFIAFGLGPYTSATSWLNIAQGLAVLEIFHAAMKWVKSPVLSTVAQVLSRLVVLVMINVFVFFDSIPISYSSGLILVSLAWSITELVRYSFYLLSLFDQQPHWLLWMRYTFFIVLYPLGVTGEWLIIISPLTLYIGFDFYTAFVVILAIAYLYYFPVL